MILLTIMCTRWLLLSPIKWLCNNFFHMPPHHYCLLYQRLFILFFVVYFRWVNSDGYFVVINGWVKYFHYFLLKNKINYLIRIVFHSKGINKSNKLTTRSQFSNVGWKMNPIWNNNSKLEGAHVRCEDGGTNIIKILYILCTMLVTFMFLLFFLGDWLTTPSTFR